MDVTRVTTELQQNTESGKSLQRNSKQRLPIGPGKASLISHGLTQNSAINICTQLSGMTMFYILRFLSHKVSLLQRNIPRWSDVSTFVLRFYQGVIIICAASIIDVQGSVAMKTNLSSSTSNSNASNFSHLSTSTPASVEPSPSPAQLTSSSLSSSVIMSISSSEINTTSTYEIMASMISTEIMPSSVLTLSVTNQLYSVSSSLYPVNGTSDMNAMSSPSPFNALSSSVVTHKNIPMTINTPATSLASSVMSPIGSTSPITAVMVKPTSSYNSSRHFTTQLINSSTIFVDQIVTASADFTSSLISTPALSSVNSKTMVVNVSTSMTFSNASTVTLQMTDTTSASTVLLGRDSSMYFNSSSATIYMSEVTPNSTGISTEPTIYINSSAMVQINATTPTLTILLGGESTSYISASSVAPNSTALEGESTRYINASVTAYINKTTPSPTISSKESITHNVSSARIDLVATNTYSMTSSTYVNATMTSSLTSSSILNGSVSSITVLPSTNWSSTLTANTLSTPLANMTVTSSVNQTQEPITPSATVIAINTSSLSLPTPSPDQGIRSFGVDVTIVNLEFTADLNEKNSSAYKALELKAKNAFGEIFSSLPGFIRVIILKFSKGSVAVSMKAIFNESTNVTTTKIKETIIANNATKNTQNFTFSQAPFVKDECTSSFCMNGGTCQTNATVGAFCTCPSGFVGVRCDKVTVNGSYSEWSSFSECSESCKGGKMHRTRTCTRPSPQYGGRDCSGLGPDYEEKDCNSDVLCPVIWIIIGVSCAVFLILLILLIICCFKRKRKEKEKRSTVAGSQMNIVPLKIMVCDFELPTARRKSPDGSSNPEFVGDSETEEDDIYKKQLLLFLKQSHLIKPGMNLSFGDDISETSDYSNPTSRKTSAIDNYGMDQRGKPKMTSEL